ncbi:hypothetical protein BTE77_06945 [Ensifer adhaerens]|nr:hypothetical protein BTE77_06945 [Ensifer adhaerens]
MAKKPTRDPDAPAIGDTVILTGEVVWVDDDGVPRIKISGADHPLRVSQRHFVELIKATKPKE